MKNVWVITWHATDSERSGIHAVFADDEPVVIKKTYRLNQGKSRACVFRATQWPVVGGKKEVEG